MKNVLKLLPFFLMVSLLVFSCSKDNDMQEEEEEELCVTDPSVTIAENIVGTWVIGGAPAETVTFNSDGTGSAAEAAFDFTVTNEGKTYTNFTWEMDFNDYGDQVKVIYDYSPDVPVLPFIVSESYTVLLNNCDKIDMEGPWESQVKLSR